MTRICGISKLKCYKDAEKKLFGEEDYLDDDGNENEVARMREKCNCLPSCTSIRYDYDIDRVKYDWEATLHSFNSTMDQFSKFDMEIFVYLGFWCLRLANFKENLSSAHVTQIDTRLSHGIHTVFFGALWHEKTTDNRKRVLVSCA